MNKLSWKNSPFYSLYFAFLFVLRWNTSQERRPRYSQALLTIGKNQAAIWSWTSISALKLKNPPSVYCSVLGSTDHWRTTGVSSVYNLDNKGFRLWIDGNNGVVANIHNAKSNNWKLSYILISNDEWSKTDWFLAILALL